MRKVIRLIVVDVDDTILCKGSGITPRTLAAWEACGAAGALRCIATGRVRQAVPPLGQDYSICHGATLVLEGVQPLLRSTLSPTQVSHLWGWAGARGVDAVFFAEDAWSANFEGEHTAGLTRFLGCAPGGEPACEVPLAKFRTTGVELAVDFPDLWVTPEGEWTYVRRTCTDKGTALKLLLEHLGLARDQVICFGDDLADLPMFPLCGHAVAVGNGHPDLLAAATRIAPPASEDGVAQVLEEMLALGLIG